MKPLLLGTTIAVVGLSACHVVFHEGGQDAATAPANTIFLTDRVFTGDLGGRAGADQKCRDAATEAKLEGNFVAVLGESSTVTDGLALSRLSMARGWVRPDGQPVVASAADLLSGKQWYPISQDQAGNELGVNAVYWSGSRPTGGVEFDCNKWTDATTVDLYGDVGHGQLAAGLGHRSHGCGQAAHLLCASIDLQSTIKPPQGTGKHIFVSTVPFSANAQGRQAADAICATEAAEARLPGTYLAFLGTTTSTPISRFNGLATYQRMDGQPLGFLGGAPMSFINRSARNTIVNLQVWAGAPGVITSSETCSDWMVSAGMVFGHLGRSNAAGSGAYDDYFSNYDNCSFAYSVYCVEL
ncbi:MAG: hypothetical protein KBG15_00685 [Kofleriaceae bacterium]|nr:hypothetical protein [Kofleriaceae bacterium]